MLTVSEKRKEYSVVQKRQKVEQEKTE